MVLTFALVVAGLTAALVPATPAAAAPAYLNGPVSYSTVLNCVSVIQGVPYQENGVAVYAGSIIDTEAGQPLPGQTFYVHVVVQGIGRPCAGSLVDLQFKLPAGVTPAITAADPVYCFHDNARFDDSRCPQALPTGPDGYQTITAPADPSLPARMWPIAYQHNFEFQVPVKAAGPMTNARLDTKVKVIDGNADPVLSPYANITVFAAPSGNPSVTYPSPSTTGITPTAATSRATVNPQGVGGNAYFDLGTTPGTYTAFTDGPVAIPNGTTGAQQISADWTPYALRPGTTYHWRVRYVAGGQTYYGSPQQFTTTSTGAFTVGTGTAASCTSAALNGAFAGARAVADAEVTFACGPDPVTITQTVAGTFDRDVSIDGGGRITLRAAPGVRHLRFTEGASDVRGLRLTGADHSACGGALLVEAGATSSLTDVVVADNRTSHSGGGICVLGGGDVSTNRAAIVGNTAGTGGGGVSNSGYFSPYWSSISTNSTSADGGGIVNGATGVLDVRGTALVGNTAGAASSTSPRGGAIHTRGNAYVTISTFSGNTAGLGGALSTADSGRFDLRSVTVADNGARASGGAGAIHAQSTTTSNLVNTLLAGNTPRACAASSSLRRVTSQGHNLEDADTCVLRSAGDLVDTDPMLDDLKAHGVRMGHGLLKGSPAVDAAATVQCGELDQTGRLTGVDGDADGVRACDIGALEHQPDGSPAAPRNVTATAGSGQATVAWQAPVSPGAAPITGYAVTPYRGEIRQATQTFTGTSTSRVITGLTAGVSYRFEVAAVNARGAGWPSDKTAYVTPTGPPGMVFVPMTPCRVVDTRNGGGGRFAPNQQRSYQVGGTGSGFASQGGRSGGCGVPDGAAAVEASVTAVAPTGNGYLRAWPAGQAMPNATFLNTSAGRSTTNTGALALAPTGTQDLSVRNHSTSADYVIDVQGYFVPDSSATANVFVPITPCRVVDTRGGSALRSGEQRSYRVNGTGAAFAAQGGRSDGCGIPVGATAVEAAVTAVGPTRDGYFRAWPTGQAMPNATFLNFSARQSATNTGAVAVAGGSGSNLTVRNQGATAHYVIDVQGYFVSEAAAPAGATVFVPMSPCRVLDTRSGGGGRLAPNDQRSYAVSGTGAAFGSQGGATGGCGVPEGATATEASVTAVAPDADGFFRAWPAGQALPNATFLNFSAGQSTTNTGALAIRPHAATDLSVRNYGARAHYVVDLQGYYRPR